MTRVAIMNGPNLGRLGVREPEIYGSTSYPELVKAVAEWGAELGFEVSVGQSDDEAQLVRWLHQAVDGAQHVVLNPAAFTHYSYSLRDAAAQVTDAGLLLVEVHLSNPLARERFRSHSVIGPVATGTIAGFGIDSYRLALMAIGARLSPASEAGGSV